MGTVMTNHGSRITTDHQARVSKFTRKPPERGLMGNAPCDPCDPWFGSDEQRVAKGGPCPVLPRPITREGLTEQLIEAYEWALTLRDADAAVYAVLAIAELNGILIDSVEIQYEIQATLAELERT
jgi:hypothetical protein